MSVSDPRNAKGHGDFLEKAVVSDAFHEAYGS